MISPGRKVHLRALGCPSPLACKLSDEYTSALPLRGRGAAVAAAIGARAGEEREAWEAPHARPYAQGLSVVGRVRVGVRRGRFPLADRFRPVRRDDREDLPALDQAVQILGVEVERNVDQGEINIKWTK